MKRVKRCRISGSFGNSEIPLLLISFYLLHWVGAGRKPLLLALILGVFLVDLRGGQSQVGSLAGAAHLLNDNAGVLR